MVIATPIKRPYLAVFYDYTVKNIPMGIIEQQKVIMQKWASNISRWIGSTASVMLHTVVFLVSFLMPVLGLISFDRMLLVLTTIVSLEAIYLSIFIQMSINMNNQKIDIIQEDIEEIGGDIEEIQKDVDEIQENVEEIQEDVDEIQEDVDEMQGEPEAETTHEKTGAEILGSIEMALVNLQKEIEQLKGLK